MAIELDNKEFYIRMRKDVAYFKAMGHHGKKEANVFASIVNEILEDYSYPNFASLCNFKALILSEPKAAMEINKTIKKIADAVNYKCNAIVVSHKFFEIVKAYLFSFYLKNIHVNTRVFYNEKDALEWIETFGFEVDEIKEFTEV